MKMEIPQRIIEHYHKACEKHPVFCTSFVNECCNLRGIKEALQIARKLEPTAQNILEEECLEIYESYLQGDKEHAIDECYDAITVLIRMVEYIEGEIGK